MKKVFSIALIACFALSTFAHDSGPPKFKDSATLNYSKFSAELAMPVSVEVFTLQNDFQSVNTIVFSEANQISVSNSYTALPAFDVSKVHRSYVTANKYIKKNAIDQSIKDTGITLNDSYRSRCSMSNEGYHERIKV